MFGRGDRSSLRARIRCNCRVSDGMPFSCKASRALPVGASPFNSESMLLRDLPQNTRGGRFRAAGGALQGNELIASRENGAKDLLALRILGELRIAAEIRVLGNGCDYSATRPDAVDDFALDPHHFGRGIACARRGAPIMVDLDEPLFPHSLTHFALDRLNTDRSAPEAQGIADQLVMLEDRIAFGQLAVLQNRLHSQAWPCA